MKDNENQNTSLKKRENSQNISNFVLEKDIFSNIFKKDIRRVYMYKKAERIAKALHLIAPAFKDIRPLRDRLERIALSLIDASVLDVMSAREALSRELLLLSSVLELARTSGHLSSMNADIISKETHNLLQEIAAHEDPHIMLEETPSLAALARSVSKTEEKPKTQSIKYKGHKRQTGIGQISSTSETGKSSSRRDSVLSVIRTKGTVYIKDLSHLIRNVSEKTLQRELQALVLEGVVKKTGERRWTTYMLASSLPGPVQDGALTKAQQ